MAPDGVVIGTSLEEDSVDVVVTSIFGMAGVTSAHENIRVVLPVIVPCRVGVCTAVNGCTFANVSPVVTDVEEENVRRLDRRVGQFVLLLLLVL